MGLRRSTAKSTMSHSTTRSLPVGPLDFGIPIVALLQMICSRFFFLKTIGSVRNCSRAAVDR
jgi:hypothetical protein